MTKKDKLSDAVGGIDDKYVEEAGQIRSEKPVRKKNIWFRAAAGVTAAAAALAAVFTGVWLYNRDSGIPTSTAAVTQAPDDPAVVVTDSEPDTTVAPLSGASEHLLSRVRESNGVVSDIEPLNCTGGRISATSSFRITLTDGTVISEQELKRRLQLSPDNEFVLKREADGSYLLESGEPFPEGAVVKLGVADAEGNVYDSWAFQTEEEFRVLDTYPADKSDSVYDDSGIEIDLSMPVDQASAADHFEITPAVNGIVTVRGEKLSYTSYRNTLYFIPYDGFDPDTVYTVTIKKGLKSTDGIELDKDYSFKFRTAQNMRGDYFYTVNGISETFLEGDPAVIEIQSSTELKSREFDTVLYRFGSADAYYAALESRISSEWSNGFLTDISSLDKVFESSEVPAQALSMWQPSNILLPDDLEEGYYIADITCGEMACQYYIEVVPMSVYALSLGRESVFFVNDTITGKPAVGADITVSAEGRKYTAKVSSDGTAKVDTGSADGQAMLDIAYNGHRYVDRMDIGGSDSTDYADKFYMFLYTDREAYLTTDTINVWGMILPREKGVSLPAEMYLCFGGHEEAGCLKNRISVASDGSFMTSFSFRDQKETYWTPLELTDGENVMCCKNVVVRDYVKPTYVIDITAPEYAIMPQEERVPVSIDAEYFEGTPAPGLQFTCEGADSDPSTPVTDSNGHAESLALADDRATWEMTWLWASYTLTGVENEYSTMYFDIPAFYRDVMLLKNFDRKTNTITFNAYNMDFSRMGEFLNSTATDGGLGSGYYCQHDYRLLMGTPADTEITINVQHSWSEKVENGTYYNYLEKRTEKRYDYKYHTDDLGTYTVNTVGGVGTFTSDILSYDTGSYRIYIYYRDSCGRQVEDSYWINANGDFNEIYRNKKTTFCLKPDNEHGNGEWGTEYSDGYEEARFYNARFAENDTIRFSLISNNDDAIKDSSRILFTVSRSGFISASSYEGTGLEYKTTLDCLPDAVFSGAYFDGRHVYPIYGGTMYFNPAARDIKLTVTSDKDKYDAGEKVKLEVTAKDTAGNGISGATVMLSMVDEAAFAVAPQSVDLLSSVYRAIYYAHPKAYCSYVQHVLAENFGAEKGGGDGSPDIRKEFRDTAYFGSAKTDADGKAYFEITLPDNITSWRATVLSYSEAETGRVYAGCTKSDVIATRPVFITPVMTSEFIEGDDIAVSAKCSGIDGTDTISVTISGSSGEIKTVTIHPAETASFGKLPKGEYTVRFSAEKNGSRDAVELPLTVTDTLLETDITRTFLLEDGIDIKPTKWPIDITLYNREYMFVTDILNSFMRYRSDRLDMRMASVFAGKEFGWGYDEDSFRDEFLTETQYGLAKLLPSAAENVTLTAMICAAFPEAVDREAVIASLESALLKSGNKAAALMGLAALGQPVLSDIRDYIAGASFESASIYDRLYAANALALCGDYGAAYDLYASSVPEVTVNDSDPDNVFAYIKTNGSDSDNATAAALMTASLLKLPEADQLARRVFYANESNNFYKNRSESYVLQLAVYCRNFVPRSSENAVVTYKLNGSEKKTVLEKYSGTHISFTEDQWNAAGLTVSEGSVYAAVRYTGKVNENDKAPTISVKKDMRGDMFVGGTVTVEIHTAPYSRVYDVIPTCGRYIDVGSYVYRSGQKVILYADNKGEAVYRFRVCTEGEYVVESAVAERDDEWGQSQRSVITIGGSSDA